MRSWPTERETGFNTGLPRDQTLLSEIPLLGGPKQAGKWAGREAADVWLNRREILAPPEEDDRRFVGNQVLELNVNVLPLVRIGLLDTSVSQLIDLGLEVEREEVGNRVSAGAGRIGRNLGAVPVVGVIRIVAVEPGVHAGGHGVRIELVSIGTPDGRDILALGLSFDTNRVP